MRSGWGSHLRKFVPAFTVIYWVSILCWLIGHYAYIAQTPDKRGAMGITWSLGLTGEAGFIVALLAGLAVGNFLPGVAMALKDGGPARVVHQDGHRDPGGLARCEGRGGDRARVGHHVSRPGGDHRGLPDLLGSRLFHRPEVLQVQPRMGGTAGVGDFDLRGVGGDHHGGRHPAAADRADHGFVARGDLFGVRADSVAHSWHKRFSGRADGRGGLDGAGGQDRRGGRRQRGDHRCLIRSQAAGAGIQYEPGWLLTTTTTVKVFIDVFIGIWALVLAAVWAYGIEKERGQTVPFAEILERFPRFVVGYFALFLLFIGMVLYWPESLPGLKNGTAESELVRGLFFVMTFFSIGMASNFRRLWAEGIGRLALVYVISLFGFIIWIGLAISWLFFHGVQPPLVSARRLSMSHDAEPTAPATGEPSIARRARGDSLRAAPADREEADRLVPGAGCRAARAALALGQCDVFSARPGRR